MIKKRKLRLKIKRFLAQIVRTAIAGVVVYAVIAAYAILVELLVFIIN